MSNMFSILKARFSLGTLTLRIPTTHICVENTVLAFMICLLFNLSYNFTVPNGNQIFCNHYSQRSHSTSRFSLHITIRFGNKVQNANFSAKEQHQKLHLFIVNF